MAEFRMPSLGADMDAGILVEWLVKPGDRVKRGDIVAVVETQKGAIDVEIFDDGYVQELIVPVGVKAPVDSILAVIGESPAKAAKVAVSAVPTRGLSVAAPQAPAATAPAAGAAPAPEAAPVEAGAAPEAAPVGAPRPGAADATPVEAAPVEVPRPGAAASGATSVEVPRPGAAAPDATSVEAVPVAAPKAGPVEAPRPGAAAAEAAPVEVAPVAVVHPLSHRLGATLASPRARHLGRRYGLELASIAGTGPHGSITGDDVERARGSALGDAAPKQAARRRGPSAEAQAAMRRAIAAAMARSKREIPHYYLSHTLDFTAALTWLGASNKERSVKERLLPVILPVKAVARALCKFPELNGTYEEAEGFIPSPSIHLGFAVAMRGGGLVAPALHDADKRGLGELMVALRDLVGRVRGGGLRSSELGDPTITVTSLGDRGVDAVQGVIYPRQVAIVGVGTPRLRPWVVDGAVVPRTLVDITLAADHRVSDGHRGALFLAAVDRLLQDPEAL